MRDYSTKYFLVYSFSPTEDRFIQVGPFWTDEALDKAKAWIKAQNPNCSMSEPWEYPVMDHIGEE